MVERVDQGQGGGAVEGAAVIQGGGDAHRRLVDVWDAEVDFTHRGQRRESIPDDRDAEVDGRMIAVLVCKEKKGKKKRNK